MNNDLALSIHSSEKDFFIAGCERQFMRVSKYYRGCEMDFKANGAVRGDAGRDKTGPYVHLR